MVVRTQLRIHPCQRSPGKNKHTPCKPEPEGPHQSRPSPSSKSPIPFSCIHFPFHFHFHRNPQILPSPSRPPSPPSDWPSRADASGCPFFRAERHLWRGATTLSPGREESKGEGGRARGLLFRSGRGSLVGFLCVFGFVLSWGRAVVPGKKSGWRTRRSTVTGSGPRKDGPLARGGVPSLPFPRAGVAGDWRAGAPSLSCRRVRLEPPVLCVPGAILASSVCAVPPRSASASGRGDLRSFPALLQSAGA